MAIENEKFKLIGLDPKWLNRLCIELFNRLNGLLERYIYFEDRSYYLVSSIYVLLTHLYSIFDEVPYLSVSGLLNSGKSRLGDLFEGTSFNPKNSSDFTPASLYRIVDQGPITFIIDEAENLSQQKRDILHSILRSGYRRNGKVVRCDKGEPKEFSTFCPKIIINQGGINNPALESRTIPIPMIRSQNHLETFRFAKIEAEFKEIRDLIRVFVQGHGCTIYQKYISFQEVDGLANRDLEVWTPIFIIAEIFDSAIPESSIRVQMLELARRIIFQRKRRQLIENRDAQILEATRAFIEAKPSIPKDGKDFYVGEQLCESIKKRWDITGLKTEQVSRTLNSHSILIDIRRIRLNIKENGSINKIQKSCYQLDRERLTELTRDYF